MFGFATITTDFIITQWSDYLAGLTGLATVEAVGKDLLQLFPDLAERGIDSAIRHVIETGAPLTLSRILHGYIFAARDGSLTDQSANLHPLMQGERVVGVILHIQDVSDRSQIEIELRSRLRLLEALREIDHQAVAGDLGAAMQPVVDAAASLLAGQSAYLCIEEQGKRRWFASAQSALPEPGCPESNLLYAELKRSLKPLQVLDAANSPLTPPFLQKVQVLLAAPLVEGGQFLGAMVVASQSLGAVSGDAAAMLESLAGAAAAAVVSCRRRQAQRSRVAELEGIQQISTALRAANSTDEIIHHSLEHAVRLVNGGCGVVLLPDRDPAWLRVARVDHLPPAMEGLRIPLQGTASGLAYQAAQPQRTQGALKHLHDLGLQVSPEILRALEENPDWIYVPFLSGQEVLGVLAVGAGPQRSFAESDSGLLMTTAEIMAVALQRSMNLAKAERRAAELSTLNELSQRLAHTQVMDEACILTAEALAGPLGYALAAVTLFDPTGGRPRVVAKRQAGMEEINFRPEEGATAAAAREDRLVLVDLPGEEPSVEMCAPVRLEGRLVGTVTVQRRLAIDYETPDQDTILTAAAYLGLALSNIQRYDRISATAGRLKIMDEAARKFTLNPRPGPILQTVLRAAQKLVGFERGGVFLVDEERQLLRPAGFVGTAAAVSQRLMKHALSLNDGLFGEVYRTRQPVEVVDTAADPRVMKVEGFTGQALTCFPLIASQQVMALVDFSDVVKEEEVRILLTTLCNRGAVALRSALLHEEMERLSKQREVLLGIAGDLAAVADDAVLNRRILATACRVLHLDGALLGILESGGRELRVAAVQARGEAQAVFQVGQRLPLAAGLPVEAAPREQAAVIVTAADQAAPAAEPLQALLSACGAQALLAAPLIFRAQVMGLLVGAWMRRLPVLSQQDLVLAQGIANQAALALGRGNYFGTSFQE